MRKNKMILIVLMALVMVGIVGGVLIYSGVFLYNGKKQVTIKEPVVQGDIHKTVGQEDSDSQVEQEDTIENDYYQSIVKHQNEQQEIAEAKKSEQESKEQEILDKKIARQFKKYESSECKFAGDEIGPDGKMVIYVTESEDSEVNKILGEFKDKIVIKKVKYSYKELRGVQHKITSKVQEYYELIKKGSNKVSKEEKQCISTILGVGVFVDENKAIVHVLDSSEKNIKLLKKYIIDDERVKFILIED